MGNESPGQVIFSAKLPRSEPFAPFHSTNCKKNAGKLSSLSGKRLQDIRVKTRRVQLRHPRPMTLKGDSSWRIASQ